MPMTISSSPPLISLGRPRQENSAVVPILQSGFRSFFFSATLAAIFLVPTWLFVLSGVEAPPYWSPVLWHAHEMIFGYAGAVIAGFLLTAGSNWTKTNILAGRGLLLLNLLWLLGRVTPLIVSLPPLVVFAVDMAFFPALAFVLGRVMLRTKNRRNYLFVGLLTVFSIANLLFHGERWGFDVQPGLGKLVALRVIAMMLVIMGGRIFPMFTRNATGNMKIRSVVWLDRLAIVSVLLPSVLDPLLGESRLIIFLWGVAGLINLARMSTWGSLSARDPLLWILHLGYFSLSISFILHAMALLKVVPVASALHCFTLGGVGLLTLGMMARVSLGHTGRLLVAPPAVVGAFVFLSLALVVRVGAPLVSPQWVVSSWHLSGALWTLAFVLFLSFGLKVWFSARVL